MTTAKAILQLTGADSFTTLSGSVHSLHFQKSPDQKVWRQVGSGWMPRRNTRAGREIAQMIADFEMRAA